MFKKSEIETILNASRFQVGLRNQEHGIVTSIQLDQNIIPFLGKKLTRREALQVDFFDLKNSKQYPEIEYLDYIDQFKVILDLKSKNILKISSPFPTNTLEKYPYPTRVEEEQQYRQSGEMITDVPHEATAVSFLKALKNVESFGPNIKSAKQIFAYLVIHRTVRYNQKMVWIIQVRGIEPFTLELPFGATPLTLEEKLVTIGGRNHIRHIVDASTGEWLGADTIPQPKLQR